MTRPNAIDVTKLHEDQLPESLGKADWVIALPEELPDLTITPQWRHALQVYAEKQFVRWVMDGTDRVLVHDYDPSWDHSGILFNLKTDSLMLLIRHNLLSDWAENEYTGQSEATFASGMGLAWTTYDEDIRDYIEEHLKEYFSVYCKDFWKIEDLFEEERWSDSDIPMIIYLLASTLLKDILQFSTADAWKQFESEIRVENEARRKEAAQYHHMLEQVRQFWEHHFPDLTGIRIEMPLFHSLKLEKRITRVLADADPDIVGIMAEIHEGHFPGSYSHTVGKRIQDIVKRATV